MGVLLLSAECLSHLYVNHLLVLDQILEYLDWFIVSVNVGKMTITGLDFETVGGEGQQEEEEGEEAEEEEKGEDDVGEQTESTTTFDQDDDF